MFIQYTVIASRCLTCSLWEALAVKLVEDVLERVNCAMRALIDRVVTGSVVGDIQRDSISPQMGRLKTDFVKRVMELRGIFALYHGSRPPYGLTVTGDKK